VKIILPLGVLLFSVAVWQQPAAGPQAASAARGTVQGKTFAPSGEATLPGTTLDLLTDDGKKVDSTTSDGFGTYRFTSVEPGKYRLRAVKGLLGMIQTLTVRNGERTEVNLTLQPPSRTVGSTRSMPPAPPMPPPPPPTPTPARATPPAAAAPSLNPNEVARIPVFYATDRAKVGGAQFEFGPDRNPEAKLFLGRYTVSIPRDHREAQIERPTFWTFYREHIGSDFVIVDRQELTYEGFYQDIRSQVGKSTAKDAFVFIHGYNVLFDDAIYRTAQLKYDIGFEGAAVAYSWPSVGTVAGYPVDEANNEWTVEHLRWFLADLSAKSGADRIHLIAHSMGNRALTYALKALATTPAPHPRFQQIILTAPDIDTGVFREVAGVISRQAQHTTLYASKNDKALLASRKYQGYPRAGDISEGVVIVSGVDTIDASAVSTDFLGHSYFADNTSVLTDLQQIILKGILPGLRQPTLSVQGQTPSQYWIFR
jgi:esterase/lipase superfamily enzyme